MKKIALIFKFNNFYDKYLCFFGIFYIQLDNIYMGQSKRYSLQMVLDYVETHGVTKMIELPKNLRNYIYRDGLVDELPFNKERRDKLREKKEQEWRENRLQDWYNIEPILSYLERWAYEEGTTLEQQAKEGFLEPEWEQWCIEHPEYKGR